MLAAVYCNWWEMTGLLPNNSQRPIIHSCSGSWRTRWMEPSNCEVQDGRALPIGEFRRIASNGGTDDGKDSRANDSADAKCSERDGAECLMERILRQLRLGDQFVDRLGGKDLAGQVGRVAPKAWR